MIYEDTNNLIHRFKLIDIEEFDLNKYNDGSPKRFKLEVDLQCPC